MCLTQHHSAVHHQKLYPNAIDNPIENHHNPSDVRSEYAVGMSSPAPLPQDKQCWFDLTVAQKRPLKCKPASLQENLDMEVSSRRWDECAHASAIQQKCVEGQVCQALETPQQADAEAPWLHGTRVLMRDRRKDWETGRKQANGRTASRSVAQAGGQCTFLAHCSFHLPGSSGSCASRVAGTAGIHHHAQLILFAFLVEAGFHHVGLAALELLASSDPPTLASQSAGLAGIEPLHLADSSRDSCTSASQVAGITGAHHHARLNIVVLVEMGFHHVGQAGLELLTSGDLPALVPKCWDYRGTVKQLGEVEMLTQD
ncbi:hypothetical protein AAY473_020162 [Plecturocebus cupreus]